MRRYLACFLSIQSRRTCWVLISRSVIAPILTMCMGPGPLTTAAEKENPVSKLLYQKTEGPFQLELWDDAPAEPWRMRESHACRVRAVSISKTPVALPDFSRDSGHMLAIPSWSVVGADFDNSKLRYDFLHDSLVFRSQPHKFIELAPGKSLQRRVNITPAAPDSLLLTAEIRNSFLHRAEAIGIPVGVARNGRRGMITGYKKVPVENAWTGSIHCGGVIQVSPEAPPQVARQQETLRRLLADPATDEKAKRQAFDRFVAPEDWLSWKFCLEVLEEKEWAGVHDAARERAVRLAQLGLAAPEWDEFLKRLDTSPRWAPLRVHFVGIVAWIAGGPSPVDSIKRRVVFLSFDRQTKAAFAVLRRWATEGPEELKHAAREAIKTFKPDWTHSPPPRWPLPAEELPAQTLIVKGSWSGVALVTEIAKAFQAVYPQVRVGVIGGKNKRGFEHLAAGKMDILIYSDVGPPIDQQLRQQFAPPKDWPERYVLGDFALCFVVNSRNPTRGLSRRQLRGIFGDPPAIRRWSEVGGGSGDVVCYGERQGLKSPEMVACQVLQVADFQAGIRWCNSGDSVLQKVSKDPGGIGFLSFPHEPLPAKSKVKFLSFRGDKMVLRGNKLVEEECMPSPETILAEEYPLRERLYLFLPSDASLAARTFCEFALNAPPTETSRLSVGIWTTSERPACLAKLRLADFRAGKGTPIHICGEPHREDFARGLANEYVTQRRLVQVKYEGQKTPAESLARFLDAGELLVSEGPVTQKRAGMSAEEWASNEPEGGALGYSAVGVVVHPDNGAKELTLEDLRLIYSGEIDKWPAMEGAAARIRMFGLASDSPVMKLVEERVGSGQWAVGSKKTEGTALTHGNSPLTTHHSPPTTC